MVRIIKSLNHMAWRVVRVLRPTVATLRCLRQTTTYRYSSSINNAPSISESEDTQPKESIITGAR